MGASMTRVVIVGAGGHARELLDILDRCPGLEAVGFVSEEASEHGTSVCGLPVLGGLDRLEGLVRPEKTGSPVRVVLGVGSPAVKQRWAADPRVAPLPILVDPSAITSRRSLYLGSGVVLCANAIISNHVTLGDHVHVNRGAQVAHDCTVGSYTHLAPGSVMSGRCHVGAMCEIGANATILPGVSVGDRCVVGAGAVVAGDLPPGTVVAAEPGAGERSLTRRLAAGVRL